MDKLAAMQTFVRVVDSGTFTRVADLMNVPKSSVTRLIQELEKELGVRLLHRTSRQLTLTQEGQIYYEGSIRVLDEVGSLDGSVLSAIRSPKGKIRVELPGSLAYQLVVPAMPDFFARYPDVQVELSVGNRSVDLIAENLDCVLRLGPLLSDSLIARSAGTLPLVTCASPAYIQRHGLPREPADLMQGHTIVRMNSPRSGRDFVFQLHRDEQLFEIHGNHRLSVNDSCAALAAGLAGLGVLTTYAFLVTPHLRSGALVRLFPDWRGDDIAVHVAYPANRHLASKVRVFVEWAIELLRASEPA
ncbi:LysR family transcriptional regulator [Paraburkholderia sp. MM5482-R1]|uniref:LysR family transcriptional regulator n=1 Tax=unclassified Paraburkholderia TaxID=2615204 RepID=UPI003D24A730